MCVFVLFCIFAAEEIPVRRLLVFGFLYHIYWFLAVILEGISPSLWIYFRKNTTRL